MAICRDDQEIGDRRYDDDQARAGRPHPPSLAHHVEDRLAAEDQRHERQCLEGLDAQSQSVFPERQYGDAEEEVE
jgi:DNA-directed RNA polymerase specialized sigma24 family protein